MSTEQASSQDQQDIDVFSLSDEEFDKLDPSTFESDSNEDDEPIEDSGYEDDSQVEEESEESEEESQSEEDQDEEETTESEEDASEEEDEDSESEEDSDEETDSEESEADSEDTDDEQDDSDQEDENEDSDTEEDSKDEEVNYEQEYKKLLEPFRAAGKEMQVQNVDEARQLMQMGVDYNRKMAAMKPVRKTMKLLEKHDLLSEDKLNFLIDIQKGNPDAIKKLIKDQGIDPMDMDVEEESNYKPNSYDVDDRELALDEVLEDIQSSPTYQKTIDVASHWDEGSKGIIAQNPQLLQVIDNHMANGIYDLVSKEVERLRTFGGLKGMTDLEAYKTVGDRLDQEGAFKNLTKDKESRQEATPNTVPPKAKAKTEDPKLKEKKRAASPRKAKKPATKAPQYNPLEMSDEEFEKQFNESLL